MVVRERVPHPGVTELRTPGTPGSQLEEAIHEVDVMGDSSSTRHGGFGHGGAKRRDEREWQPAHLSIREREETMQPP